MDMFWHFFPNQYNTQNYMENDAFYPGSSFLSGLYMVNIIIQAQNQ